MMRTFREMPIKQKLMAVVMATTVTGLLLAGVGLFAFDTILGRRTAERDLLVLSHVVADNSSGAVAFDDRAEAAETLNALRARPHIAAACIFMPDGSLFASYVWTGPRRDCAPPRSGTGLEPWQGDIAVWRPIERGSPLATLTLRYDLGELAARRRAYAGLMAAILIAATLGAFFLAARLRDVIAAPVAALADSAASVSRTRDYSIRAPKLSGDELGVLVDSFNEMLAGIQSRDQELQSVLRAREDALREAETARNSLRTTLLSIGDAVLATDAGGRVVLANPVALTMLRRSQAEVVGKPIDDIFRIFNEYSRAPVESPVSKVLRGSGIVGLANHTILVAGDGTEIPIDDSGAPIVADGRIVGAVLVFRDVTERRRAERDTAFLAALVESSGDAVIGCSPDGVIQSWNAGAERLYRYTAAEMVGRSFTDLVPPERLEQEKEILARLHGGERMVYAESQRRRRDGILLDVALTASPILDRTGELIGISRVTRDITEQKQQAERLRQTQKLESIGILAGGIAHDFNNLLAGILGNASLALEESGPGSPVGRHLADVIAASEKAAELTRQMLAYSGRGQFVLDRIDLSARIRETLPLIQASIRRNVDLRLDLAEPLPAIEADPAQIQQLLMNIVINAAEAIPESRAGRVTVTTRAEVVDGRPGRRGAGGEELNPGLYVAFEVADTGVGMDEATRSRIFDPFFTTKFTGRGLGLAAVLGIVRGHKGSIEVASAPGEGATFRILLPAVDRPAAPRAAERPAIAAENGFGGKVLVVDDEEVVRRMARQILERHRCAVLLAEDGARGVEIFSREADEIGCVVLDLTMPVMGG